jgi:NAD(P)H dehydrogenase (quinone)
VRRATRRSILTALIAGAVLSTLPVEHTLAAAENEKIIVSGASGRLGALAVKELLSRGVPAKNLILVSRTPETLAEYKRLGADTRFGDFAKPESLPAAYAGGTRLLLISIGRSAGPRPEAHKRAIDAAKAAGVKQIAYTSWIGISRGETAGLAVDHAATEEILRKSGVAWTFLRNSIYMDGVVNQAARMLSEGKASVPADEVKVDLVTREDCAAAAVAVLITPGHDNKAYDISGPEMIGVREIAAAAAAVSGKPIEVIPAGAVKPEGTTTAVPKLIGKPATSVKTFLAANKDRLTAAR